MSGKCFEKDVLENLSGSKLLSKDLVTAWLDTHVPDGDNLPKADHDKLPEPSEQSEPKAPDSSKHDDSSQLLMELKKEKELRERLETMLKVERQEREKLEQKLVSQQNSMAAPKEPRHSSPHGHTTTDHDTPPVTSRANVRYAAIAAKTTPINKPASLAKLTSGISLSQQNCHTLPSFTQPLSRAYKELDCHHQCIGCKPRLKCTIINSRNFIKLIKIDRYTCSYHRRISFKLKKASLPLARPPLCDMSCEHTPPPFMSCDYTTHPLPATQTNHSQPPVSVSPAVSTASSIISVGQETNLFSHSTNPTEIDGDSDYIPSPTPSPPREAAPSQANTRQPPNSTQIQQGFNPTTYRLLPRTCGQPLNNLKKKVKLRPLDDITNKRAGRRVDPITSITNNALSVFDYTTPERTTKHRLTSKVS